MRISLRPSPSSTRSAWRSNFCRGVTVPSERPRRPPPAPGQAPEEKPMLTLGAYGPGWDFYAMKGRVEALLKELGVTGVEFLRGTWAPR